MHALLPQLLFYFFAALTIISGLMVVSQNNPVRCVLFLVLAFFGSAVLWLLLSAEFLALILVLVYVGAVMTLFLFVVMMLDIDIESIKGHLARYMPFGLILVALLTGLLLIAVPEKWTKTEIEQSTIASASMTVNPVEKRISNTEEIGAVLYTDYVYALEIAAMILLVAIIAAITLAHRTSTRCKKQDITRQIMTKRSDRVELISMKSVKKQ